MAYWDIIYKIIRQKPATVQEIIEKLKSFYHGKTEKQLRNNTDKNLTRLKKAGLVKKISGGRHADYEYEDINDKIIEVLKEWEMEDMTPEELAFIDETTRNIFKQIGLDIDTKEDLNKVLNVIKKNEKFYNIKEYAVAMKKLLLTSTGFSNQKIIDEFIKMVNKWPAYVKVIFIPTASEVEEYKGYIEDDKKSLVSLGIKPENIKVLNLDHKVSYEEISDYDVIFVSGGNTFYLMQKVRESGFDEIIKQFVKNGKVYVAVSAGSVIAGPNIEIAGIGPAGDKNDVGLKDLTGLKLTNIIIYPHFTEKDRKIVHDYFLKHADYTMTSLSDNQALLILNDDFRTIGE
ncbi:MAG: Type 1 glutamine amidotransferase-like domain-containing protein [Nanoarchaeota archaeon]|nr:Type 1 glutamine amidotransferase-like domain-containing protein [Nanoarchaeota archaeon]